MSLFNPNYQPDLHEEIHEKNKENPFVVLVGWISCEPKHLKKYLEWYSQNNFDVIWYCPKDSYHYFSSLMEQQAKDVIKLIQTKYQQRPFFFHCFSGNMLSYSYVVEHMDEELSQFLIGSIFDSCPNHITGDNAYNSVTLTSQSTLFKFFCFIAFSIYEFLYDTEIVDRNYFKRLNESKVKSPQLYIYSLDDKVCPAVNIKEHIKDQKKKRNVWELCFEKSKHVQHFKIHHKEYTEKVKEFTNFCIKSKL